MRGRRAVWLGVALALFAFSLLGAVALTLPYPTGSRPFAVAVYSLETRAPSITTQLRFEGTAADWLHLTLTSDRAIGPVTVVTNGIASCEPDVGTLEELRPSPSARNAAPYTIDAYGQRLMQATTLTMTVATTQSRQNCQLTIPARRFDFSSYGREVLTGYRFFNTSADTEYRPVGAASTPATNFLVRFDDGLEDLRFEGGSPVGDSDSVRALSSESSSTKAKWKDPHFEQFHEFALWTFAAIFALGLSMIVELIKPRFLEDS